MFFKDTKILGEWDQQGFFPGPNEEFNAYAKRVQTLNDYFSYPTEDIDHFLTEEDWIEAKGITEHLYDFSPEWIVAHYSNRKLTFFQGAATWLIEKDLYEIPVIQLKKKFERGNLFKLYYREEVLAHEAVHAARMGFEESLFEEIFAYQTSPRWGRRFFGPLFYRPWEAVVFLILLLFPVAYEILQFFDLEFSFASPMRWLPLFFFGYLFIRLCFLRFTLWLAKIKIISLLINPKKFWAVFLRLSDREIFTLAYRNTRKKEALFEKGTYRTKHLKEKYFKKDSI